MINKMLTKEHLGMILAKARNLANMSQREMAKRLNVSTGTISNWEQGMGCPDMVEFVEWFDCCGISPLKPMLDFFFPSDYEKANITDNKKTRDSLVKYVRELATDDEVEKLAYNIYGATGSDWHAQLEMWTAHNHTTLRSRVNAAQFIFDSYEMEKACGDLIGDYSILPNEAHLRTAILTGKKAVFDKKTSYS